MLVAKRRPKFKGFISHPALAASPVNALEALAAERGELLEEELSIEERRRLFWKPEDLVVPDRAKVFAPENIIIPLADFVREGWRVIEPETPLLWNWHIDTICAHLEAVSAGQIRRLLINIPPGHMKSLLVSVFWPAWAWLHLPGWRILCASSGLSLATRDSAKCKDLILSEWYRYVFQPQWQIKTDSKAKASYQNTKFGLRHAVSVGAATTGFRGNALLIDDPLQAMDAFSDPVRAESLRWYDKAAASRLADPRKDSIVIIMQRLHHEDLSGHVLRNSPDKYEHLCLPSYFEKSRKFHTVLADTERWKQHGEDPRTEENELLFPEFFTKEVLESAEKTMDSLEFAGQHQQRPTPAAGNLFKAEYFCPDKTGEKFWPASLLWDQIANNEIEEAYICWDTNAKKKVTNDYSGGCLICLGGDGVVLLVPLVLEKMDVPEVEKKVLLTWAEWKLRLGDALQGAPIEEGASNATAVVQYSRRLMKERRKQEAEYARHIGKGLPREEFEWQTPLGWKLEEWELICGAPPFHPLPYPPKPLKKEQRARGVLSYCQGGNVRMVSVNAVITRRWLDQMLAFPLSKNDDAVDASVTGIERFAHLRDNASPITMEMLKRIAIKDEAGEALLGEELTSDGDYEADYDADYDAQSDERLDDELLSDTHDDELLSDFAIADDDLDYDEDLLNDLENDDD